MTNETTTSERKTSNRREISGSVSNALLSGLGGYGDPEDGLTIYLQYPMATCCICGEDDLSRWGVPIAMDGPMVGLIVANDYAGDWAGKPACRDCWRKHEDGEFVGHDPAF